MTTSGTVSPVTGPESRPTAGGTRRPRAARRTWRRALRRDWQLYSLAVLPLLFFLIFRYLPMLGNVIAFRRFRPGEASSANTGWACGTSACS